MYKRMYVFSILTEMIDIGKFPVSFCKKLFVQTYAAPQSSKPWTVKQNIILGYVL